MKKIFYFLVGLGLVLVLFSCEKRETNETQTFDCKCGTETSDIRWRYTDPHQLIISWSKDYRSNCTQELKTRRETRYKHTGKPDWADDKTWCLDEKW